MYVKQIIQEILENIKMLQVNFIMISIIYKILVLLKITRILKQFLRSIIIDFYSQHIMKKISMLKEYRNIKENIIKDIRSLFRLKKANKRDK